MEPDEIEERYHGAVDNLGKAILQVGVAMGELLYCMGEVLSAVCKQLVESTDFSFLTELLERYRLEEQKREEDRQKALKLELVSERIVKLSRSKRYKVRKKNMSRIRKELRLYEKRR